MLVVGRNLRDLVTTMELSPPERFDENSIQLTLDDVVLVPRKLDRPIAYEVDHVDDFFEESKIGVEGLLLKSGQCALACSQEVVRMPLGYFGFIQTKGSLARLFCSLHMCDPQIEPGYEGKITFELANHSPFDIVLRNAARVGQLFVFRCSTSNSTPYSGRYNGAAKPTIYRPA